MCLTVGVHRNRHPPSQSTSIRASRWCRSNKMTESLHTCRQAKPTQNVTIASLELHFPLPRPARFLKIEGGTAEERRAAAVSYAGPSLSPELVPDCRNRWYRVKWLDESQLDPARAEKLLDTYVEAFDYAERRRGEHPTGRVSRPLHSHEASTAWAVCVDQLEYHLVTSPDCKVFANEGVIRTVVGGGPESRRSAEAGSIGKTKGRRELVRRRGFPLAEPSACFGLPRV